MTSYPQFWNEILKRLGLDSFEGIENIRSVLTFMGYTTAQSISKLNKQKELSSFLIEVGKLSTNAHFSAKFPDLQYWRLEHGSIGVLKDIASAAFSVSISTDELTKSNWATAVQQKVFEDCSKVRIL